MANKLISFSKELIHKSTLDEENLRVKWAINEYHFYSQIFKIMKKLSEDQLYQLLSNINSQNHLQIRSSQPEDLIALTMAAVMLQLPFKSDLNSKEKIIRSVYWQEESTMDLNVSGYHNDPVVIQLTKGCENYRLLTNVPKSDAKNITSRFKAFSDFQKKID